MLTEEASAPAGMILLTDGDASFVGMAYKWSDLNRTGSLLFFHFFLQLTDLAIQPDQIEDNPDENSRDNGHDDPDFAIGPEPVGHLYTVGNGLLGHQVLAEQQQGCEWRFCELDYLHSRL